VFINTKRRSVWDRLFFYFSSFFRRKKQRIAPMKLWLNSSVKNRAKTKPSLPSCLRGLRGFLPHEKPYADFSLKNSPGINHSNKNQEFLPGRQTFKGRTVYLNQKFDRNHKLVSVLVAPIALL
jgi:hypothetical protein